MRHSPRSVIWSVRRGGLQANQPIRGDAVSTATTWSLPLHDRTMMRAALTANAATGSPADPKSGCGAKRGRSRWPRQASLNRCRGATEPESGSSLRTERAPSAPLERNGERQARPPATDIRNARAHGELIPHPVGWCQMEMSFRAAGLRGRPRVLSPAMLRGWTVSGAEWGDSRNRIVPGVHRMLIVSPSRSTGSTCRSRSRTSTTS